MESKFVRRFSFFYLLVILGLLILACGYVTPSYAQMPTYTYTYTGNPMSSGLGNGCGGCTVTGSFTTSQPLSANLGVLYNGRFDPLHAPFVVSYSFTAGEFTFDNNSAPGPVLGVVTDSNGTITGAGMFLVLPISANAAAFLEVGLGGDSIVYTDCSVDPCVSWASSNKRPGTWSGKTKGDIRAATVPFTAQQSAGPVTINWVEPFPDTNYTSVCTVETAAFNDYEQPVILTRSLDSMTVNPTNGSSTGGVLDCIAIPDSSFSHVRHARTDFSGYPLTVTALWSQFFPDPTQEAPPNPAAAVCTTESQDNNSGAAGGDASLISLVNSSGIIVNNSNGIGVPFQAGTMHCVEVPDTDRMFVRGVQAPLTVNATLPITWNVSFPDSNYVAACSNVVPGAFGGSLAALAIYAGSKTPSSMTVIPGLQSSAATANCIALPQTLPPPPPATACSALLKNSITVGPISSGVSKFITATFIPQPAGSITLAEAEDICGYTNFDWQQTVTEWPNPSALVAEQPSRACLGPLDICVAPPSFLDPVLGGYVYQRAEYPNGNHAFPLYYDATTYTGNSTELQDHELDDTLTFYDSPSDPCLLSPSGTPSPSTAECGYATDKIGSKMAFKTRLVGICGTATGCKSNFGPGTGVDCTTLQTCVDLQIGFTWTSTFNGTSGGVSRTQNSLPPDPGSGTGGITITSINSVPGTPPNVACTATPSTLWPPNGKSMLVTVSGNITTGTSALTSTTYAVEDEYGLVQPNGSITLGAGGSYSFGVPLIAARNGDNLNGRTYTIVVTGSDTVGNAGACSAVVTVPHDQGQ